MCGNFFCLQLYWLLHVFIDKGDSYEFLKTTALFIDLYSFLWYNVYIKTDKNKRQQDSKITKNNTLMLYPYGEGGAVLSVWLLSGGSFYAVLEKSQTEVLQ